MNLILVDVDGTLLPGPSSEWLFFRFLVRRRVLGPRQFAAAAFFTLRFAPRYGRHVWKKNKAYLSGLESVQIRQLAEEFVTTRLVQRLRPAMIARLDEHKRRGDTVALLTGTPDFIAAPLAGHLEIGCFRATHCATRDGRFIAAPPLSHPFHHDKLIIARNLCDELGSRLGECIAYADSHHDRLFLEGIGTAVAVAPGQRLVRVARAKGWEIVADRSHSGRM